MRFAKSESSNNPPTAPLRTFVHPSALQSPNSESFRTRPPFRAPSDLGTWSACYQAVPIANAKSKSVSAAGKRPVVNENKTALQFVRAQESGRDDAVMMLLFS